MSHPFPKKQLSCIWQIAIFLWKVSPFLWKWIWRNGFTHQKENGLSCPFCFKVTPIFGKEYDTPFKEAQLPSIWKGTPANGRKCFTHKIAHPPKASSLKWKTAHPQRILRMFIILVCKGYIWKKSWCLRSKMNEIWLGIIWVNLDDVIHRI